MQHKNTFKAIVAALLLALAIVPISGCSKTTNTEKLETAPIEDTGGENQNSSDGAETNDSSPATPTTTTEEVVKSGDIQNEPVENFDSNAISYTAFSPTEYPNYVRIYDIPCTVDVELQPGEIRFSDLDELGRSGRAVGKITIDLINESAGWRTEFAPNSNPAGWGHNGEVTIPFADGKDYHGWLYNRSHLIADSLGGYTHVYKDDGSINEDESTTPKTNLITGTRTQNVGENNGQGGMQLFENATIQYLKANPDDPVWYSARPVYEGDELLPRSVIVSAKSDSGNFDIVGEVFNYADGINIDYSNGTWSEAK